MAERQRTCCETTIAQFHNEDCPERNVDEAPFRHANGQPCYGCQICLDEAMSGKSVVDTTWEEEVLEDYEKRLTKPFPSWLGRFEDNGWSIRITPKLTDTEWSQYKLRANETWSDELRQYDPAKALELLTELFGYTRGRELKLIRPPCGQYVRPKEGGKRRPCGEPSLIVYRLADVFGDKRTFALCPKHKAPSDPEVVNE